MCIVIIKNSFAKDVNLAFADDITENLLCSGRSRALFELGMRNCGIV